MLNSLDSLTKEIDERLSKRTIALLVLKSKGFKVVIPELRIGNRTVYGIAVEGDRAYVVFPNGLEEEIKKVLKVKEVVVVPWTSRV